MANEPSSTSNFVQIEDTVINKVVDASATSNDISLDDSVFIFKKNSKGQIDKVVNASVQWLVDEFGKEAVQAKTDAISAKDDASTSATNAKASETSASGSATKALASETNAKTSETNASTYAGQAKTSETNAKASETASKTYKEQAQSLLEQADLNLIESIEQTTTSTEPSGKNVVTITQKDGTKSTFNVYNGAEGVISEETISAISLKVFPVGSIYMSVQNISPASFIGGTWEPLKDRFLVGAGNLYAVNEAKGEATHTLTIDEMPSHSMHLLTSTENFTGIGNYAGYLNVSKFNSYGTVGRGWNCRFDNEMYPAGKSVGGSQAHNNLPPYLAVYMWKRTA